MLSEYEEMEMSYLEQSKDLKKYKKLIESTDDRMLEIELENLQWQIRGCIPDLEESFKKLKEITLKETNKRKKTNDNRSETKISRKSF